MALPSAAGFLLAAFREIAIRRVQRSGSAAAEPPAVLEQWEIDGNARLKSVTLFGGKKKRRPTGRPQALQAEATRRGRKWIHGIANRQEILGVAKAAQVARTTESGRADFRCDVGSLRRHSNNQFRSANARPRPGRSLPGPTGATAFPSRRVSERLSQRVQKMLDPVGQTQSIPHAPVSSRFIQTLTEDGRCGFCVSSNGGWPRVGWVGWPRGSPQVGPPRRSPGVQQPGQESQPLRSATLSST